MSGRNETTTHARTDWLDHVRWSLLYETICCDVIDSDLSTFAQRSKVRFNAQSAGDQGDADTDTFHRCSGSQHKPGKQISSFWSLPLSASGFKSYRNHNFLHIQLDLYTVCQAATPFLVWQYRFNCVSAKPFFLHFCRSIVN